MRRAGKGVAWLLRALPLCCAMLAVAATLVGRELSGDPDASGSGDEAPRHVDARANGQDDACAPVGQDTGSVGARKMEEGTSALELRDVASQLWNDGSARESSLDGFLKDLSQLERAGAEGEGASGGEGQGESSGGDAVVFWTERSDVPKAAGGVLRAYAKTGTATLATSGYVDLRGDVWCAIVRSSPTCVDMILTTTEDGRESTVRIARLTGKGR